MNKKILSIFALIMAISILGISCADNNTTAPTTTTPPIEADKALAILNGVTTAITTGGTSFDFTALQSTDIKQNGMNYEVTIKDTTASSGTVPHSTFKTAIEGAADEMITASQTAGTEITIDKSKITITVVEPDKKKSVVTIPYTLKDNANSKGSFVITFELAKSSTTATFELPTMDITVPATLIQSIQIPATDGEVTSPQIGFVFTDPTSATGLTAEITAVAGLGTSNGATGGTDTAMTGLSADATHYTLDLEAKTLTISTAGITALRGVLTDDTTVKAGVIEVTFTIKGEGYEDLAAKKLKFNVLSHDTDA